MTPLQSASQHRKNKQFTEALAIYTAKWAANPQQFVEWDGWSYAFCLKETKEHEKSLDICRQLYRRFPTMQALRQLYAWCIYHTQMGAAVKASESDETLQKAVQAIVHLCPPNDDPYCPSARSIIKLAKHLAAKPMPNWGSIANWLQQLDPDRLDGSTFTIDGPRGKPMEMASLLEEWYSLYTKALMGLENWQACIDLCHAAQQRNLTWHYSNDIWFARRKAFALGKLGKKQEAASIFRELVQRKREWFLLQDLASLVDEPTEALALLAEAALMPGEASKKIRLYQNLGQLCMQAGNRVGAIAHLLLTATIRLQMGWSADAGMLLQLQEGSLYPEKAPGIDRQLQQLHPLWVNLSNGGKQLLNGIIASMLPGNRAGFIRTGKPNESYYFSAVDALFSARLLVAGTKVRFVLKDGYDKKKDKQVVNAVKVQLA